MLEEKANESISEEDAELLMDLADTAEDEEEFDTDEAESEWDDDEGPILPPMDLFKEVIELRAQLRQVETEREARERELLCLNLLGEAGLPLDIAPTVMAAEDMETAVEVIRRTVAECVKAELTKRCRGDAPLTGGKATLTKEELMRLPVAELQRIRDMGICG